MDGLFYNPDLSPVAVHSITAHVKYTLHLAPYNLPASPLGFITKIFSTFRQGGW